MTFSARRSVTGEVRAVEGLRPFYLAHAAPDIAACADFIEEIRMMCANAKNLDRKSGEHGAPVHNDHSGVGVDGWSV